MTKGKESYLHGRQNTQFSRFNGLTEVRGETRTVKLQEHSNPPSNKKSDPLLKKMTIYVNNP